MKNKNLKILAAMAMIVLVCVEAFSKPQQNTRTAPKRANSSVLGASAPISTPKGASSAKNAFGNLPLRFEKNQGQSDPQVQYIARGAGYTLFLTGTDAVLRLNPPHSNPLKAPQVGRNRSRKMDAKQLKHPSLIRMKLSGANIAPKIEAANKLPGAVNYLIGNDPKKWHTGVPTFGSVQYSGIYPGIDVVYYGNQRQLEYDFVVNPGGDPGNIAFEFEGAMDVALSSSGDLSLDSPAGEITARKPSLYQVVNGQRAAVEGAFVARQGRKFGVEVKNYDHTKPLVIDPVLVYSSYLGGSGDGDLAMGVAVDSQGCAYITGFGSAVDFPVVGTSLSAAPPTGNLLAFVSKLNQNGTELVYSTYLGGTTLDGASAIAVDWKGQAYVVGATVSVDFPVTPVNAVQVSLGPGATWNAFLAKLTADGQSLLYSTYLGGAGDDEAMGVAVDANENAFVAGYASSSGFPVTTGNAFQPLLNSVNGNAFVTRIDTTQAGASSLVYSTFLGGSSPYSFSQLNSGSFGGDAALGIAIDTNENAYVVGEASSTDFPITSANAYQTTGNAHNSVFLARLDTNQSRGNSLVYSTFLGGTGTNGDLGYGISLDSSANAYITGCAFSADFPVTISNGTNSAQGKAFVAKLNTNLSRTVSYSILVGGTGGDCGSAIVVDPDGDAYVGGFTWSSDFPVTAGAVQSTLQSSGSANGFLITLSPDGRTLLYGTYLGGSGTTSGDYVNSLAMDSHENLYIAGQTDSANFPTTQGALQTGFNGSTDGFVTEVSGIVTTPQISSIFPTSGGIGTSVTITGSSFGVSRGSGRVLLGGMDGLVVSWSDTQVVATVSGGSQSGPVQILQAGASSNAVNFIVNSPVITSVSPNSGAAGTPVTIAGSGFGNAQGSGTVFLGSRPGTVVSWSDTAVVATVATGSVSGSAQVRPNGVFSNTVPFTVITAAITSVSPTSGTAGTQVTVTGSGFGNAQGAGQVLLGTVPAQVSSWSDGQVVATVAVGSMSGTAQVLQSGIWSNSVAFTVSGGPPQITSINPNTGSGGTVVTIQGTGFGSSQGSGIAWIGGTNAAVTLWSDTQVTATVGDSAVSGIVKIQQNGVWSNAVTFTVPSTSSVTLNPNIINMLVGGTSPITALNSSGKPVAGLTWVSSDSTVVTLSNDDPPVLTAVGPGNVTITAGGASADVTVYAAGTTLPLGTVLWSDPGDGSGVECCTLYPAVPSPTGVADVFAMQVDGSVEAITSDGAVAWTTSLPPPTSFGANSLLPDFQGGTVVFNPTSIYRLDGITGQPYPAYNATTFEAKSLGLGYPAIHTDGTIFTIDYACAPTDACDPRSTDATTGAWVVGIDPSTGTTKFRVPTVNETIQGTIADSFCGTPGSKTQYLHAYPSSIIIAGDGYAYISYLTEDSTSNVRRSVSQRYPDAAYTDFDNLTVDVENRNLDAVVADLNALEPIVGPAVQDWGPQIINNLSGGDMATLRQYLNALQVTVGLYRLCDSSFTSVTKLHLMRVGTDGSSSDVVVKQWNLNDTAVSNAISLYPYYTTTTTQSAPAVNINGPFAITNADQGALFSWSASWYSYCALGTTGKGCAMVNGGHENHLTTMSGGAISADAVWNDAVPGQYYPVNPVLQLQDGSFVGSGGNSMVAFDASGNVRWTVPGDSPQIATVDAGIIGSSGTTYDANGLATGQLGSLPTESWRGNAYQLASVEEVLFRPLIAATIWSFAGGNPSNNGGPGRPWYFILNWQNAFDFIPFEPQILPDLKTDITSKATAIKTAALNALKQAYKPWPVVVVEGTPNTGDHQAVVKTTSTGQGPTCGFTNPNQTVNSTIVYECNMEEAQNALQVEISNVQDEAAALARQDLIQAIGRGIGNNAAHEIAHQFLLGCCSMDALSSQDSNAAGTYNSGDANGSPDPQILNSDPSPYTGYAKDGKTEIHWESTTKQALTKCLDAGWTDYGVQSCAGKLNLSLRAPAAVFSGGVWGKTVLPRTTSIPTKLRKVSILPLLSDLAFVR